MTAYPTPVALTPSQQSIVDIAHVGLMTVAPFYAYLFYAEVEEVFTLDVPTAATDGRRLYINPEYLCSLKKPGERVFVYAHEMEHWVCRDPERMVRYSKSREINYRGQAKPFDKSAANIVMDLVRNANLVETSVGEMNPDWAFDPNVKGTDLFEEVYLSKVKVMPPPPRPQPSGSGQDDSSDNPGDPGAGVDAPRYGDRPGARGDTGSDKHARAHGGSFDHVMEPRVDPVTGREDLPSEGGFREAVARAAAAAKAMGKLPASLQRLVEEILQPKVDWREHLRMAITARVGNRGETWDRPNRRRLVLNPLVIMPGRRGYGADTVVVAIDTSGSIYDKATEFMAEAGGVLNDCRPKRVILIACDAQVHQADEAAGLDDLVLIGQKGLKGGGGTSFIPVFEYLARENIKPDALIYLTDLEGSFPSEAPNYPVIWCATTDHKVPFGEVVRIEV